MTSLSAHVAVIWAMVASFLLVLLAPSDAAPLSGWVQGTASFFGGPPDQPLNAFDLTIPTGSCGYGSIDPRLYPFYYVVGLHPNNTLARNRPMNGCGTCLEVSCIDTRGVCYGRPVMAVLTDECVEGCNATNINFHVFGFETLAPIRFGRVDIKYRQVECEPADPIAIRVSDYRVSQGGWIRLSVKWLAGDAGISKVELTSSKPEVPAGSRVARYDVWREMRNTFGGNWEYSGLPSLPFDIRITNVLGQAVVLNKIITVAGGLGEFQGEVQFPLRSSSSADSAPFNTTPALDTAAKPTTNPAKSDVITSPPRNTSDTSTSEAAPADEGARIDAAVPNSAIIASSAANCSCAPPSAASKTTRNPSGSIAAPSAKPAAASKDPAAAIDEAVTVLQLETDPTVMPDAQAKPPVYTTGAASGIQP